MSAYAGADFGFRSDSSALVVVEGRPDGSVDVVAIEERRPARGLPLRPSVVVADFAAIAKAFGCVGITSDGHYRESVAEHLETAGMVFDPAPEGQQGKARTYLHLRQLISERTIRLPRHPRLIAQLKALVSKPLPGGGLAISSPRKAGGGHGDIASALVLALWSAREDDRPRVAPPAHDTDGGFERASLDLSGYGVGESLGDAQAAAMRPQLANYVSALLGRR